MLYFDVQWDVYVASFEYLKAANAAVHIQGTFAITYCYLRFELTIACDLPQLDFSHVFEFELIRIDLKGP